MTPKECATEFKTLADYVIPRNNSTVKQMWCFKSLEGERICSRPREFKALVSGSGSCSHAFKILLTQRIPPIGPQPFKNSGTKTGKVDLRK